MTTSTRQGILPMLGLSTAHLPPHLGLDGLAIEPGVFADRLAWGWLILVPDADTDYDDKPGRDPAVVEIVAYARGLGADYVLFDAHTEPVDDLPLYEW